LLCLLVLALAACGEETSEVITALKKNGFKVGPQSDERLVYIGSPQDTSVKVNDQDVLVYRFADRDDLRKGIEAINDIAKAGNALWGYDIENLEASYYERGLYIVYFGDHPDAEKIRRAIDRDVKFTQFETARE
jgi:hypothetical protein